MLTDRQKNTQRQKHNHLGRGNEWVLGKELLEAVKIQNYTLDGNRRMSVEGPNNIPGQRRGRLRASWWDKVKARTGLRLEKAMQAAAD